MVGVMGFEPTIFRRRILSTFCIPFQHTPMKNITRDEIEIALQGTLSMRAAAAKLPYNFKTFRTYALKYGLYKPNPAGKGVAKSQPMFPLEDVLANKHPGYHSYKLKYRLINELGWDWECHLCKLTEWMGKQCPLELDHMDGNNKNNSLSNLRLLCPNCHAQTSTYRNKKRIPLM